MSTSVIAPLVGGMLKLVQGTDGVIISSSHALEGETLASCQKYARIYPVGIQIAPTMWSKELQVNDPVVHGFLERHEPRSVIFISFG